MNDKYKVKYLHDASNDIRKIHSHIRYELGSTIAATRTVNRIQNEARSLDFMPYRYALVDQEPWRSRGLRKLPVNNYTIFYTVIEDTKTVEVKRVIYGKRDFNAIFGL